MKLDKTDAAILALLQHDGRITNKDLAARVGLSASACFERVKRLQASGVIAGYRAVLDWSKLGAAFDAWAEIEVGDIPERVEAFAAFMRGFVAIVSAHRLAQPHVFIIHFVAVSIETWRGFLLAAAREGFALTVLRLSLVMECVKAPSASLAPLIARAA